MSISVVNTVIIDDIQRLVIKQKHIVTINTVDLNEMIHFSGLFFAGSLYGYGHVSIGRSILYQNFARKLSRGPSLPL